MARRDALVYEDTKINVRFKLFAFGLTIARRASAVTVDVSAEIRAARYAEADVPTTALYGKLRAA